jgi:hypothetical protein
MEQPTKTQAVKRFLELSTHPDLASLYNHDMEMQCNVAQDGGQRVDGEFQGRQWHGWTDGTQLWKSFRIPWKAMTEPEYKDEEMKFDLAAHAEGIGMTGWNWMARKSLWVAYDFDAITGHSEKHQKKLSEAQLEDVAQTLAGVPWCTLRKSTSGKGLHLYVFLVPVETHNHNEHAALARAILSQLTAICRFDFVNKVDTCGGNMWIWHRKMKGTDGLKLLKAGQPLEQVPLNWRDHLEVCSGKRRKTKPIFVPELGGDLSENDRWFEQLAGQQSKIPLDEAHQKLVQWLNENKCTGWWDQDHWMLVTHTFHLKEAHGALQMRGKFETVAEGTHAPGDHNCFCFPMRNGAWVVRRYGKEVAEAETWDKDASQYTRCYYNKQPDLKSAARAYKGSEHPQGGYTFRQATNAVHAAELLGAKLGLPDWIQTRETRLKEHKDGRLVVEIRQDSGDSGLAGMEGWICESGKYKRVYDASARDTQELDVSAFDDVIRHIVSPSGDDCGWAIQSEGRWKGEPLTHVKHALTAMGHSSKDVNMIIGTNVIRCWTLVNLPFQDEYPSGREWNRNAAQFRFRPTTDDNPSFPTWSLILAHIGKGLDTGVRDNAWCKNNAILTGADYLKCWVASLFQYPLEPLPYLFFFGDPNAGKSLFHEALSLLVTHGVVRADQALVSNFNGELANAVVCVVEETDLRRNKTAYNRIKDWVTARQLSIRALYEAPYLIPNATHWIQCSNDFHSCPILPGDARIVYIEVAPIPQAQIIPKRQLIPKLEKEAADFLKHILTLEIPSSPDRLNIPVVNTEQKEVAEAANQTMLEIFIKDYCHYRTGLYIKYSEFCDRFLQWLDATERVHWRQIRIGRELPPRYPKGRMMKHNGQFFVGNLSWEPHQAGDVVKKKLVRKNDILVEEE